MPCKSLGVSVIQKDVWIKVRGLAKEDLEREGSRTFQRLIKQLVLSLSQLTSGEIEE